jgi:ABC-type Fe3+-hydroxamate transport system substrate-binding protein
MNADTTQTMTDQMGRHVVVPLQPQRIISLVPSQTELLFDLGLARRVVGRTRFCIHPAAQVKEVAIVGGTKQFNFDRIDQLQPDLIIGNKEENYRDGIERLAAKYPVWMSDILTLDDALAMIRQVGQLVGKGERAAGMAADIKAKFAQLPRLTRPLRVGYFIWQKPYMVAGGQTFIHDMLTRCGFVNAFADMGNGRYPELTVFDIQAANLDTILLSSEPFPFAEKHRKAFERICPGTAVYLVDGEMFSWYGSRLRLATTYWQQLVG